MSRVNVEEDDEYIYVTMPYDEDAKEALKDNFKARWNPDDKNWKIRKDDHRIEDVEKELKLHFRDYR